jgi:hypothetical protein
MSATAADVPAVRPATLRARLIEAWEAWARFPTVLFLSSRVALLAFATLAMRMPRVRTEEVVPAFLAGQMKGLPTLNALCRWDCVWYEVIAREGYKHYSQTNFWPLFPWAAGAVSSATGMRPFVAVVLVANLFAFGAYLLIYRLFLKQADAAAAKAALVLLVAYPFSFFHSAGYPESAMMFFSALALTLAASNRHVWAGLSLGIGVLARQLTLSQGAALVRPAIAGLAMPFAVLAAYCGWLTYRFGEPFPFIRARKEGWGESAYAGISRLWGAQQDLRHWLYFAFSLLLVAGTALLARRLKHAELVAAAAGQLLLLYAIGFDSLGRYTASCWPAFLGLGLWMAKRPTWLAPSAAMLALFQGMLFALYVHAYPIL